jgi:hypothetical protein
MGWTFHRVAAIVSGAGALEDGQKSCRQEVPDLAWTPPGKSPASVSPGFRRPAPG